MSDDQPTDDPSFLEEHGLLRRIPSQPSFVTYDENLGRLRPTSANFLDVDLSVSDEAGIIDAGQPIDCVLVNHQSLTFSLARFTAGLARNLGQRIYRDPTDEDPHHSIVLGNKPKKAATKIAKCCSWAIEPEAN